MCNRDARQMNIGSLADESGYKRMTTPKGTILKQTHSGKRRCKKDEADALRTPNVNTGNTYCNYEMHTLTFFYIRATNDVERNDEYYLSSLSLFSGAADVS